MRNNENVVPNRQLERGQCGIVLAERHLRSSQRDTRWPRQRLLLREQLHIGTGFVDSPRTRVDLSKGRPA